ncbi:MAG: 16S rRNA (guanine(966)-N(2))-methyltransferase RsmD [Firmicutes bacterium]|nr:16S rRNA (guanine(966)-N(2))-methyltransferase RsmD [Bacillota bacterium]
MRVIAGKAKGAKLSGLAGTATRPSSDRLKEALFNILSPHLFQADFLDLYAGNGGMGIEALSRGAGRAVFLDSNPACVKIIKKNLDKTGLLGGEVYKSTVRQGLRVLKKQKRYFHLIFFDPPYGRGLFSETLKLLDQYTLLRKGGIIVGESGKKEEIPAETSNFCLVEKRRYGNSQLSFFRYREDHH